MRSREATRLRASLAARAKAETGQALTAVEFAAAIDLPLAYILAATRRSRHPFPLDEGRKVRLEVGLRWLDGEAFHAGAAPTDP